MTIKGYPNKVKDSQGAQDYATLGPLREQQIGVDVIAHVFSQVITAGAVVNAGSTTRVIQSTAHGALVGDAVSFTSGTLNTKEYRVAAATANTLTLAEPASAAPAASDTFQVLRPKYPTVDSTGALALSVSSVGIKGKTPGGVVTKTWTTGVGKLAAATYTQLFAAASVASAVTRVYVADTGGQFIVLATGAAASEVDQIYLEPGFGGFIDWAVPAGTRIAARALNTDETSGTFVMTLFG